jgi:hypothetical protein
MGIKVQINNEFTLLYFSKAFKPLQLNYDKPCQIAKHWALSINSWKIATNYIIISMEYYETLSNTQIFIFKITKWKPLKTGKYNHSADLVLKIKSNFSFLHFLHFLAMLCWSLQKGGWSRSKHKETSYMVMSHHENERQIHTLLSANKSYGNVVKFKCLGITGTNTTEFTKKLRVEYIQGMLPFSPKSFIFLSSL